MKGTVVVHRIESQALAGNWLGDPAVRSTPIYLPPGYGSGGRRFPVVYFLHGYAGSGAGWLNVTAFAPNVPERLDSLIDRGVIPPVIGVFVDGWTRYGGAQWLNSETNGHYSDYVARDVVEYVDRRLDTVARAEARAIVGKSSGGFGALAFGRDWPETFAHVACHSGDSCFEYCYLPDFPKALSVLAKTGGLEPFLDGFVKRARETRTRGEDFPVISLVAMAAAYSPRRASPLGIDLPFDLTTGAILPGVWEKWLANDPVRFVPSAASSFRKLSTVFIDCGLKDEYHLQWGTRQVVRALRDEKVEVMHEEFEDGHSGIHYRYDRSLTLLAPRLSTPSPA